VRHLICLKQFLRHGRDRYTNYCAVCHDPLGAGRGKIVERSYTQPPSYHIPRLPMLYLLGTHRLSSAGARRMGL
jgi:hypothetical protein